MVDHKNFNPFWWWKSFLYSFFEIFILKKKNIKAFTYHHGSYIWNLEKKSGGIVFFVNQSKQIYTSKDGLLNRMEHEYVCCDNGRFKILNPHTCHLWFKRYRTVVNNKFNCDFYDMIKIQIFLPYMNLYSKASWSFCRQFTKTKLKFRGEKASVCYWKR